MKIRFEDQDLTLDYNEQTRSFGLYDADGELYDRTDPPGHLQPSAPNTTWVDSHYLDLLVSNGIVTARDETEFDADGKVATLCDIVHGDFNDQGYSLFGDFSRTRLGQQCQYGSRYITGRLEGYPNLGEGLRFLNADSGNYHSIRIHRDDMDEFERRYRSHQADRLQ